MFGSPVVTHPVCDLDLHQRIRDARRDAVARSVRGRGGIVPFRRRHPVDVDGEVFRPARRGRRPSVPVLEREPGACRRRVNRSNPLAYRTRFPRCSGQCGFRVLDGGAIDEIDRDVAVVLIWAGVGVGALVGVLIGGYFVRRKNANSKRRAGRTGPIVASTGLGLTAAALWPRYVIGTVVASLGGLLLGIGVTVQVANLRRRRPSK